MIQELETLLQIKVTKPIQKTTPGNWLRPIKFLRQQINGKNELFITLIPVADQGQGNGGFTPPYGRNVKTKGPKILGPPLLKARNAGNFFGARP